MAKSDVIQKFIESMKESTDGLLAVSVVEISSGMSLGVYTSGKIDPDVASAYNVEVIKAKYKALKALGLKEYIDDILITLESQYHLINCSKSGSHMIYVAASKEKSNLAILRNSARKGMLDIEEILS